MPKKWIPMPKTAKERAWEKMNDYVNYYYAHAEKRLLSGEATFVVELVSGTVELQFSARRKGTITKHYMQLAFEPASGEVVEFERARLTGNSIWAAAYLFILIGQNQDKVDFKQVDCMLHALKRCTHYTRREIGLKSNYLGENELNLVAARGRSDARKIAVLESNERRLKNELGSDERILTTLNFLSEKIAELLFSIIDKTDIKYLIELVSLGHKPAEDLLLDAVSYENLSQASYATYLSRLPFNIAVVSLASRVQQGESLFELMADQYTVLNVRLMRGCMALAIKKDNHKLLDILRRGLVDLSKEKLLSERSMPDFWVDCALGLMSKKSSDFTFDMRVQVNLLLVSHKHDLAKAFKYLKPAQVIMIFTTNNVVRDALYRQRKGSPCSYKRGALKVALGQLKGAQKVEAVKACKAYEVELKSRTVVSTKAKSSETKPTVKKTTAAKVITTLAAHPVQEVIQPKPVKPVVAIAMVAVGESKAEALEAEEIVEATVVSTGTGVELTKFSAPTMRR